MRLTLRNHCWGIITIGFVLAYTTAHSAPCQYNNVLKSKSYVCYSGQRLTNSPHGYVIYGTRGCFLSRLPCCRHNASQYGRFASAASARYAYNRCNDNYPHHWGDFF